MEYSMTCKRLLIYFTRDWSKVEPPEEHQIIAYERLPDAGTAALNKLAVLKVNGGLGTSMGEYETATETQYLTPRLL